MKEINLVRFGPSPIHGLGAFAKTGIPAGTSILEYVGERITKSESLRRCEANNFFIFALDDQWDLDGSSASNPARYLNHSCAPNTEAQLDGGRIWMIALREIREGEELTFDYGYDLEAYQEHPCACGAAGCVGFIVAGELANYVRQ